MPEFDLRIRESDWIRLRKHCAPSFRGRKDTEIGAIGLLGKRTVGGALRELIVAQILWPEPGDVLAEAHSALTFTSRYIRRAHLAVRKAGLAGLVTFHTHPLAGPEVGFSPYDDAQDPLLVENLQELWPGTLLSSVVMGADSQQGRVPVTLAENLVTFNMKPVATARNRNEQCDICQANPHSGFGDCSEAIGLASDVAASLLEEEDEVAAN